jgi:hypothetical protein
MNTTSSMGVRLIASSSSSPRLLPKGLRTSGVPQVIIRLFVYFVQAAYLNEEKSACLASS